MGVEDQDTRGGASRRRDRSRTLARLMAVVALGLDCGGHQNAGPPAGSSAASPALVSAMSGRVTASATGSRDHMMHRAILGPWWGSGCPRNGECGCGASTTAGEEFTCQIDHLRDLDIPVSLYLFDGSAWSERDSRVEGTCTGEDCCSWNLGDDVINRLSSERVRALVHFWGGCHAPDQYERVRARLGGTLLGFYLDDGSSDQEFERVNDFMRKAAPGDFENIAKSHQSREPSTSDATLARLANAAYVGDLSNDFDGLREGITRLLDKSRLLPAPLNELTAYDYERGGPPDEETYHRRIHFGAFQPVMAHTPFGNSDPWRGDYSYELIAAYRYYGWLHKQLIPYFMTYARRMHDSPASPMIQPGPGPYAMRVGEEIFVPFVTAKAPTIDIQFPPGAWVDYWDEDSVYTGALSEHPAPKGREPVFFRLGALIPMEVEREYTGHGTRESAGSLTVLVYPSGTSSFRYYNDDTATWTTFQSTENGDRLTLTADSSPGWPLLYRVARMSTRPSAVGLNGRTVTINQPGSLPELESEAEVNGSSESAWFYDARARRLIVKVMP